MKKANVWVGIFFLVLTLSGLPVSDTSADADGTAALAIITDQTGAACISALTVANATADVIIANNNIVAGQTVTLIATSTITHG